MRRLGTVLCVVTTVCLTWCAHASPLSSGTEAVPFRLKRGFHPTPSTRVLPLVYLVTWGGCAPGPPTFARYRLLWRPRQLTVTLFVHRAPPPPAGTVCPLDVRFGFAAERIRLPHALGWRALFDGSAKPPRRVRPSRSTPSPTLGAGTA